MDLLEWIYYNCCIMSRLLILKLKISDHKMQLICRLTNRAVLSGNNTQSSITRRKYRANFYVVPINQ